ncbi:2-dehydro-3-deoxygalactonokinase [Sinisalibacter aestuarii]|uniref:2-keto-3-deoxy-galactonokinase n=1 Tax=Sinisalibacter aestuarii TaxID=2949426 RepID=A0ABQ5LP74_9RHOB|nr:2-dehydro-3-deoxygalactonokinase [Sinisalibacter aestuarii]GKY86563.1 2-keto-3-deoxy-galactonokinase [Sinisalibacter aestuarii]
MSYAAWIAVDWGNSNLRLWAMGPDGPIAERKAPQGTLALPGPEAYEPALLALAGDLIAPDRKTMVLICGAVGALGGWVEAPYRQLPCVPLGAGEFTSPEVKDPRLDLRILPGLNQARPPAILRGEETQAAGFLVSEPDFDGILCLPGTHTKWMHISAGEVVSFLSFMTGELFRFLADASVLRFTTARAGFDEAAFLDAVSDAISRPERMASGLFPLRAEAVLAGLDPVVARSRLMGLLLGAELAAARMQWLGRDVVVIGGAEMAAAYATALEAQGVAVRRFDGDKAALMGLIEAHRLMA